MRRIMGDDSWQLQGLCRTVDPELFFHPDDERGKTARRERDDEAKAVCAQCPVLAKCRDEALERPERYGVWGGLTEGEREAIWAAGRRLARAS